MTANHIPQEHKERVLNKVRELQEQGVAGYSLWSDLGDAMTDVQDEHQYTWDPRYVEDLIAELANEGKIDGTLYKCSSHRQERGPRPNGYGTRRG